MIAEVNQVTDITAIQIGLQENKHVINYLILSQNSLLKLVDARPNVPLTIEK